MASRGKTVLRKCLQTALGSYFFPKMVHFAEADLSGTVKWFDLEKGYGFIKRDDNGGDLFVHSSEIDAGYTETGEKVNFDVAMGKSFESISSGWMIMITTSFLFHFRSQGTRSHQCNYATVE